MELFKDKSTFEFLNRANFLYDEAENIYDVIDKVEQENDRINIEGGGGQVVAVKKNKRGEIFIAKLIKFPVSQETDWDSELDMFFSKKHIDFDESILYQEYEDNSEENKEQVSDEVDPQMPEDMKALLATQKEKHKSVVNDEAQNVKEVIIDKQVSEKDDEIEALKAEKEALKRQLAAQQVQEKVPESMPEMQSVVTEDLTTTIPDVPVIDTPIVTDMEVDSLVVDFKQSIENRLINYVNQEQKKIDDEIQKLDKRDQIPGTVTKIYRAKEEEQIKKIKIEVAKTIELETEAEDKRHKETLANIKSKNQNIQNQGIEEVHTKIDELIQNNIESETAKQTEQLNNILQGKKNELELRKRELNEGLTSNFENALGSFNDSHEKVIEHVEEKRTSTNNVIKMHA